MLEVPVIFVFRRLIAVFDVFALLVDEQSAPKKPLPRLMEVECGMVGGE